MMPARRPRSASVEAPGEARRQGRPEKGMRARRVEEGVRVELASLLGDEVKDPRAAGPS